MELLSFADDAAILLPEKTVGSLYNEVSKVKKLSIFGSVKTD